MVREKRLKQFGELEGAPDWSGTPLDQLDFEWSPDEIMEIERYCEKILKNVAEEDMNPRERFEATMQGKQRDRLLIECWYMPVYAMRTLDSAADALKPVDAYLSPKLHVKAHLATVARYKLDFPSVYTISYTEEFWGSNAKMIEYGNPVAIGSPPIKSLADLEGLEVPEPEKDGLYPGYLWAVRELKRIFAQYGLDKVMPMAISICGGPVGTVQMMMMGMPNFMKGLKQDPELCKQTMALATEWSIKFGNAVAKLKPDAIFMCNMVATVPAKGNEWLADNFAQISKAVAPQVPYFWHAPAFSRFLDWMPLFVEKGAVGPGGACGWFVDPDIDFKTIIDFSREHDIYCADPIQNNVIITGPVSAMEEELKPRCDYAKLHPKGATGICPFDYWTPQQHAEAAIAAAKKYGKF